MIFYRSKNKIEIKYWKEIKRKTAQKETAFQFACCLSTAKVSIVFVTTKYIKYN